jgi:PKD repeat protein
VLCTPGAALAAPPTGDFTISPQIPLIGATVAFTPTVSDTDGDTVTVTWAYGDGTTGTAPSHEYSTRGTKTVTMTMDDGNSPPVSVSHSLRVNAPPLAEFGWSPNVAQVGDAFSFSSSSSDPEGPLASYSWNFGDGTTGPDAPTTSHTYAGAGTRTVTLTVTDSDGVSRSVSHAVRTNAPPVARFSFAVPFPNLLPGEPFNVPVLNNPVAFSGNASSDSDGSITQYAWDLNGDGQFTDQSAQSFVQPLTTPGIVNVGLRVTDSDGATGTSVVPIRVDQLPVASFTFSPTAPVAGQRVDFTSTSSDPDGTQDISSLQWDLNSDGKFGDAVGPSATRVFSTAGSYTIGLEAIDSAGLQVFQLQTLSVRIPSSAQSGSGSGTPFAIALVSKPNSAAGAASSNGPKSRLSVVAGIRVAIAGRVSDTATKITRLVVNAPPGARVTGRCKGAGCHVKRESHRAGSQGRVRLRNFERTFRVGTQIVITITKSGQIGKQIVFTTRRGQPPLRRELCLMPGARRAGKCPS